MSLKFAKSTSKVSYEFGNEFIGREYELTLLKDSLQNESEESEVIWIFGESGIGKNRLLLEFKRYCHKESIVCLEGDCCNAIPKYFGVWRNILSDLLSSASTHIVLKYGAILKKIIPDHNCLSNIQQSPSQNPEIEKNVMVKSIAQFITTSIKEQNSRYVFFCKNMQWCEDASKELVKYLIFQKLSHNNRTNSLHIYLSSSSKVESEHKINWMESHPNIKKLLLEPFGKENVLSYITVILGEPKVGNSIHSEIDNITALTAGNPFYIQELVKLLFDDGSIIKKDQSWEFVNTFDKNQMPKNINELILLRLDQHILYKHEQEVLHIMALLNRWITLNELSVIMPVDETDLKKLEKLEFIKSKTLGEHQYYYIFHDLIQKAVIKSITNHEILHQKIAIGIEDFHLNKLYNYTEELAYHYFNSKNNSKAKKYLKKSVEEASKNYDNQTALKYYDQWLLINNNKNIDTTIEILIGKARIHKTSGDWALYQKTILEASTLINDNSNCKTKTCFYHAICESQLLFDSSLEEALPVFKEAISFFKNKNDKSGLSEIYNNIGVYYSFVENDINKSIENHLIGIEMAKNANNKKSQALNQINISMSYSSKGDFKRAIESCNFGTTILTELNFSSDMANGNCLLGYYYYLNKEYNNALTFLDRAIDISDEINFVSVLVSGQIIKANTLFSLKKFEEAERECDKAMNLLPQIDDEEEIFKGKLCHAQIQFALGNKEEAIEELNVFIKDDTYLYEKAESYYSLWTMTEKNEYRIEAMQLYTELLKETDTYIYQERRLALESGIIEENMYGNKQDNDNTNILNLLSIPRNILPEEYNEELISELKEYLNKAAEGFIINKFKNKEGSKHVNNDRALLDNDLLNEINRNKLLQEFLDIIRNLNSDLTLNSLLTKILDACIYFLQANRGAILLYTKKGRLSLASARDNKKNNIEDFILSQTVIKKVVENIIPVFVTDVVEDDSLASKESILEMQLRSVMCAPLENKSNLININKTTLQSNSFLGIIYLDSKHTTSKTGFSGNNLQLLQTLADQASVALNNAIIKRRIDTSIIEKELLTDDLQKEIQSRKKIEKEIRKLNENLEEKVEERTEKLNLFKKKLIESSYIAGMADITSTTLHNIGNSLNTVTTASYKMESILKKSKVTNLINANDLLSEHENDLIKFLTEDPKGKKLIQYYKMLGNDLEEEVNELIYNMERLKNQVTVINDILMSQKQYAHIHEIKGNDVKLLETIEDALTIQKHSIIKNKIEIIKNIDPEVLVKGEKQKIMYIFFHIFRNALEALEMAPLGKRKLTITVNYDEKRTRVIISDTGCGIVSSVKQQIFNHGFTTKDDSKGFGLHTCANYMIDSGGSIAIESDGPDKGTRCMLEFNSYHK